MPMKAVPGLRTNRAAAIARVLPICPLPPRQTSDRDGAARIRLMPKNPLPPHRPDRASGGLNENDAQRAIAILAPDHERGGQGMLDAQSRYAAAFQPPRSVGELAKSRVMPSVPVPILHRAGRI